MNTSRKIKNKLPAFLLGELKERDRDRVEAHLKDCPRCREELSEMGAVLEGAAAYRNEVEAACAAVDWDAQAESITDRAMTAGGSRSWAVGKWGPGRLLLQPRLRATVAAMLLGAVLGAGLTWLVLRRPVPDQISFTGRARVPRGMLDDMAVEVARRDTLDYLEKSRYLLVDFMQTPMDSSADFWRSELSASRTRDLLSQKKFINPQLDQYKMAKARAICDQIEWLFLELTQISGELTVFELERLRDLIEERQLLLQISLVTRELKQSEV